MKILVTGDSWAAGDWNKLQSNNSQNYSAPLSNNINWILQDLLQLPIGPTYTSHVEVSLNLIGGGPYAITSLYEIIDNSFQVNREFNFAKQRFSV